jgi:hypothetical protein
MVVAARSRSSNISYQASDGREEYGNMLYQPIEPWSSLTADEETRNAKEYEKGVRG